MAESNLLGQLHAQIVKMLNDLPLTPSERGDADAMGQRLFNTAEQFRREYSLNDDKRSMLVTSAALAVALSLQDCRTRMYDEDSGVHKRD